MFDIDSPGSSVLVPVTGDGDRPSVVGEPYHAAPERLVDRYRDEPLPEFLAGEARDSCGDYAVVDPRGEVTRLVTSPGYAGGYIYEPGGRGEHGPAGPLVATELGDLLERLPGKPPAFDERVLERYVAEGYRGSAHLPLATVFEDVTRLPPASHVELAREGVTAFRTYLPGPRRPGTFGEAIEAAVEHYEDEDVALLFSGGADSTALYAALRATQRTGSCRLMAVETGPGENSVESARSVAASLDAPLEVYDYGWPFEDEALVERIERCLGRDLVDPIEPHYALALGIDGVDRVLSGHNFDQVATVDMRQPDVPRHWAVLLRGNVRPTVFGVARNAQYTDAYIDCPFLRRLYGAIVPGLAGDGVGWDRSIEGYLAGMLSTSVPNLVDRNDDWLAGEVRAYREYAGRVPPRTLVDLLNYHWKLQYWNAVYRTVPAGMPPVDLPSNWGPFLSYYFGRRRGLRAAVSPKPEIHRYVSDRTGRSHRELKYGSFRSARRQRTDRERSGRRLRSRLLERNRERLAPERSAAIPWVRSDSLSTDLDRIYAEVHERVGRRASHGELERAHRLLNLELLLDRVRG